MRTHMSKSAESDIKQTLSFQLSSATPVSCLIERTCEQSR